MSDTYRRYRAIKHGMMQFYQPRPTGHHEKHFNTLAALICGLVGGKHAHLPACADHAPSNRAKQESVIERFAAFSKTTATALRLVFAHRQGTAAYAGCSAASPGDGRQCGRARLHCSDAE